jgi:monovalent cation:proton antiporter-2 (CPA2) family protein
VNEAEALSQVIILLFVGIMSITLMRKIGQSPIVGYLAAGLLIGPHAFGIIHESETTHLLAELGVVFLLFDIGLHFTLSSIWEARRDIFGLGPLQIILCGLAFSGIAIVSGIPSEYAVILGGALALSSTAVVIQTLSESGRHNCPVGLTATAVLIFQDVCAIFLLILAASPESMEGAAEPGLVLAMAIALVKAAIAFIAAVLIGRYAVKPVFLLFSKTRNEEVFTAMALLVVLATAAATGSAGLSLTLGAFLGGMILSESPYRHIIQTEAKPFRNLLLGFFFITVGMSLDWRTLIAHWAEILIFLFLLIMIKTILVATAARIFGWSAPGSVQLGFLLAQGSEFVFVIIAMPMVRETLGEAMVGVVITGVAASLILTPTLVAIGNSAIRILKLSPAHVATGEMLPGTTTAPVIVFGMNNVGRSVADALEANEIRYDAIEKDHERFMAASADGYPVAFGNLNDVRLMETLAYAERDAIIITIINHDEAEVLKQVLHERYPNLTCFITVETETDRKHFEAMGLRAVINRSVPCGLDLAAAVLRHLDVNESAIQAWMQRQQERALQDATNTLAAVTS